MENKGKSSENTKTVVTKKDTKASSIKEDVKVSNKEERPRKVSLPTKEEREVLKQQEAERLKQEQVDKWEDVDKKSIGHKIFDVIFWICIFLLAFVWIFDFVQVKNGEEPKFCVKTTVHEYEDGSVKECDGLGYKVFKYNRTSINIDTQFSPFFVGMKE